MNAVTISRVKKFYCTECQVKFIVDTRRTRVRGFCPCCGDCIATEKYDYRKHNKQERKTTWDDRDITALTELLKRGDLTYGQIACHIGKTRKSVEHYIYRHSKELLAR